MPREERQTEKDGLFQLVQSNYSSFLSLMAVFFAFESDQYKHYLSLDVVDTSFKLVCLKLIEKLLSLRFSWKQILWSFDAF